MFTIPLSHVKIWEKNVSQIVTQNSRWSIRDKNKKLRNATCIQQTNSFSFES
jgi:hypothetical protein